MSPVLSIFFCAVLSLGLAAEAQTAGKKAKKATVTEGAEKSATTATDGTGPIKFNTNSEPTNTDVRSPMLFKIPGVEKTGEVKPDTSVQEPFAEAVPFKTYLGYPRHEIGLSALPMSVSNRWSYNGEAFNFTSGTTGYQAHYRVDVTPLVEFKLFMTQYTLDVTGVILSGYIINESKQTYSIYGGKGSRCWVLGASFISKLCAGGSLVYDSYPILNFVDGTHMEIDKVQDYVIGAHLNYQMPVVQDFAVRFEIGYNQGTGVGNSGSLTSKTNFSWYGNVQGDYIIRDHHRLTAGVNYTSRTAKLSGTIGANKDNWKTDSTAVGGTLGYAYIF